MKSRTPARSSNGTDCTSVPATKPRHAKSAELIQRWLDKRYAAAIQRFERAKDAAGVLFACREALTQGDDIAGALWAAWTHPLLDEADGREIFGDIHMLSHQIGASTRADLGQLEHLKRENANQREEAQTLRREFGVAQGEHELALGELRCRLADAEQRVALAPHRELELAEARQAARNHRTVLGGEVPANQQITLLAS